MKEVLRLTEVSLTRGGATSLLHGYHLEMYAGDVMLISGLAGSGILGLLRFFSGKEEIAEGRIEICEQPAPGKRNHDGLWDLIFMCEDDSSLFDNLSVVENLTLLSEKHRLFDYYSRDRISQRVREFLSEANIDIDPDARIDSLSQPERYQISLLRAKMSHAALVVMDCTRELYADHASHKLLSMIRQFSEEGLAFLLIAFSEEPFDKIATRKQHILYGRDRMEWRSGMERNPHRHGRASQTQMLQNMTGIMDEMIHYMDAHDYLALLHHRYPTFWNREIDVEPLHRAEWHRKGTVLIPRDSAHRLMLNLSVADHLAISIPTRVARTRFGRIPPAAVRVLADRFYKETGIDPIKQRIQQLSLLERKILSIYRWEQAKPGLLILQEPFFGLDSTEIRRLIAYLKRLDDQGVRMIMLTGSAPAARLTCGRILWLNGGRPIIPPE